MPIVPPEKKPKLYNAIAKIFDKIGTVKSNFFPDGENGQTKGYIFLEFENKDIAQSALVAINGYRLDKHHTLIGNMFSDVEKFVTLIELLYSSNVIFLTGSKMSVKVLFDLNHSLIVTLEIFIAGCLNQKHMINS